MSAVPWPRWRHPKRDRWQGQSPSRGGLAKEYDSQDLDGSASDVTGDRGRSDEQHSRPRGLDEGAVALCVP
jgi:hypothetical protein